MGFGFGLLSCAHDEDDRQCRDPAYRRLGHGWPDRCRHPLQCRFSHRHAQKTQARKCASRSTAAEGLSNPVQQRFIPLCARSMPVSLCASTLSGNPYWAPMAAHPLQTVEIKDLFPAAGDQTPARVQALLGRAPEHPVPTRISAENRPVLPQKSASGTGESSG